MIPLGGKQHSAPRNVGYRRAERIESPRFIQDCSMHRSSETIRGLERGLQVLQALQSSPISSLHDIHLATRISKPSLLRILNTLEHAGFVSRRLADGHYRISAFARMGRKRDRYDRVAEASAPVLDRLCQKVRWPSDLMVPAGDHMERRETSQAYSPFFLHPTHRNRVGQSIGWLLTGVGRAYLAFCPEKEREEILQRVTAETCSCTPADGTRSSGTRPRPPQRPCPTRPRSRRNPRRSPRIERSRHRCRGGCHFSKLHPLEQGFQPLMKPPRFLPWRGFEKEQAIGNGVHAHGERI
jgi:IclR helix-turn-helix domain